MTTTSLRVTGMTCGHCVTAVEKALRSKEGVREARVSLEDGSAEVDHDPQQIDAPELVAAVEEEGYQARVG